MDKFVQKPLTEDTVYEIVTRFVLPKWVHIPAHLGISMGISTIQGFFKPKESKEGGAPSRRTSDGDGVIPPGVV